MAVPTPNVQPTQIPGGVAHYRYQGPIGTVGPTLTIDLTDIPETLREDPAFRDQLYMTLQSFDAADGIVIDGANPVVLPAAPALPEYVQMPAVATNAAGVVQVLVETHHSIGR